MSANHGGKHCIGDGIKIGKAVGAKALNLEWVQVHPTRWAKPDVPDATIEFLAAEALRGCCGLGGQDFQEVGPVMLYSRGFGAVFTQQSLLARHYLGMVSV